MFYFVCGLVIDHEFSSIEHCPKEISQAGNRVFGSGNVSFALCQLDGGWHATDCAQKRFRDEFLYIQLRLGICPNWLPFGSCIGLVEFFDP